MLDSIIYDAIMSKVENLDVVELKGLSNYYSLELVKESEAIKMGYNDLSDYIKESFLHYFYDKELNELLEIAEKLKITVFY